MTLLKKIHEISTYVAVFSGFLAAIALFLFLVDEFLNLRIFNIYDEIFALAAALGIILFAWSIGVSIALSLYSLSEKK